MRNSGSESSASSHTPPPNDESPRHRSGGSGGNASTTSPRGRGANSPRNPLEMNFFTPPRPAVTPVIGVPGRSAFMPYRPPTPQWPSAGPSPGLGGGVPGFHGTVAFAGTTRISGSGTPTVGRKRGREGGVGVGTSGGGGSGSGGNEAAGEEAERNMRECSVCHKRFGSKKALFGHMRSHPDRGWKGVHPPPVFNPDEEFADIRVATAALDEAAAEAEAEAVAQEEDGRGFKVPDLNKPPPPDP